MRKIEEIMNDYLPTGDEDDRMLEIKERVQRLSEVERRVLLLYAELGSQRKLAKMLGFSVSKMNYVLKEIRNKIKDGLD